MTLDRIPNQVTVELNHDTRNPVYTVKLKDGSFVMAFDTAEAAQMFARGFNHGWARGAKWQKDRPKQPPMPERDEESGLLR